jgi:hypothetical protein
MRFLASASACTGSNRAGAAAARAATAGVALVLVSTLLKTIVCLPNVWTLVGREFVPARGPLFDY